MKICERCGQEVMENARYCGHCGYDLSPKNISEQQSKEENKKGNIFGIISIILAACYLVSGQVMDDVPYSETSLYQFLKMLPFIFALAAVIMAIIAKIMYPKNTLATFLIWFYGIYIAQATVLILFMLLVCSGMPG